MKNLLFKFNSNLNKMLKIKTKENLKIKQFLLIKMFKCYTKQ